MNKKNYILSAVCMLICISLTACGTETAVETSGTSLAINAVERDIQTAKDTESTTDIPSENDETSEEMRVINKNLPLVPDISSNLAEGTNLGHIIINGNDVSLDNATLQDVIDSTGLKQCSEVTVKDTDGYRFEGSLFSLYGDDISDDVTKISIELVDSEGKTVEDISPEGYVKGISINRLQVGKDFEPLFHMNIKAGMSREETENIYGKGTEYETAYGSARAYATDTWVMIVHYEEDTADEITLLKK